MKSITELERDIVSITLKIHTEFPELSKYISEVSINYAGKENNHSDVKKFKEYYDSLAVVVSEYAKTKEANSKNTDSQASKSEGYPLYPPSDDIYSQETQETELNPEDISKNKAPNVKAGTSNVKGKNEKIPGDDLDVPGSELDDQQENVGSEDEENNYYSLGGENHAN